MDKIINEWKEFLTERVPSAALMSTSLTTTLHFLQRFVTTPRIEQSVCLTIATLWRTLSVTDN
jgi:hypothetical protein